MSGRGNARVAPPAPATGGPTQGQPPAEFGFRELFSQAQVRMLSVHDLSRSNIQCYVQKFIFIFVIVQLGKSSLFLNDLRCVTARKA